MKIKNIHIKQFHENTEQLLLCRGIASTEPNESGGRAEISNSGMTLMLMRTERKGGKFFLGGGI